MKKGQKLESGFTILDVVDLAELKATGIWAKHDKTGAEVFHVLNDDIENLFTFAFATFPEDDTGVAHILEHAVLCGSERYPLKDAFIVLAQGSLQTFLNAITFPDKTVYPASSTNEHDYFNLMSVYGDAVFRPLIPEWTFMQEGHRLEYQEDRLSITGIVYNEMKGAYSSLDTYAGYWSIKAVMPDTPYSYESGGDPDAIPNLTYDGLKQFHLTRYSPANCRVFLAGNIPTEKQLAFLNDEFFSKIDGGRTCDPISKTERWKQPQEFHIPCPAGSELKSTIFLSWLCGDVTDIDEGIALGALAQILLGHDGSPLTRKLVESGIGEDITPVSGLEGEIRELVFVTGLKSIEGDVEQKSREVEALVMGELKRLVSEGIPPEETEAALLAMEFGQREVRRSGGPFSLVWMRRCLRTWMHGSKPWEGLLFDPGIKKIKEALLKDSRYFESLIQKYFIDNPHRALVIIEPTQNFLSKQEERLAEKLLCLDKELTEDQRLQIKEKSKDLEKIQSEADSPQALLSIPHLSRGDLCAEHDIIHRQHEDLNGVPSLYHNLYTNGITYMDFAFPVDVLALEDYSWLSLFSRVVVSVGLPGMDYGEVSSLLARTAGGFIAAIQTGAAVKGTPAYLKTASGDFDLSDRDWLLYRLKCLDDKIAPSLDLALRMICEADFSDVRRINDLVLEMKTEIDSSLAPMGHIYASGRAGRNNSRVRRIEEKLGGLSQIEFVHRLVKMETGEIIKKLENLREKITGAGLIVNITGGAFEKTGAEIAQRFGRFGAPKPRLSAETGEAPLPAAEVYASQSLQVGFAALTLDSASFDSKEQSAEMVLTHQLTTGALWEDIRMKGGAYGAFVNSDCLKNTVSFGTYRDPNPVRSLDVFSSVIKNKDREMIKNYCDEDYLEKSIIGCYAKETTPRTGAENGYIDFNRFLYGIEDGYRKRKLERLISVSGADIAASFASLGTRRLSGPVIIAGIKNAEEAAKALGTDVKTLPV